MEMLRMHLITLGALFMNKVSAPGKRVTLQGKDNSRKIVMEEMERKEGGRERTTQVEKETEIEKILGVPYNS